MKKRYVMNSIYEKFNTKSRCRSMYTTNNEYFKVNGWTCLWSEK